MFTEDILKEQFLDKFEKKQGSFFMYLPRYNFSK